MINTLRLWVAPHPVSNDHEVRIEIDGTDWLGSEHLGLDPPDLSLRVPDETLRRLVVGRCLCGCMGCGDLIVEARRDESSIRWSIEAIGQTFQFDIADYDREIDRFHADHSWEDVGRRVERLVGKLFSGLVTDDGRSFDWASTRIAERTVHLSFSKDGSQRLFLFEWDGVTAENALDRATAFQRESEFRRIEG